MHFCRILLLLVYDDEEKIPYRNPLAIAVEHNNGSIEVLE